MVIKAENLKFVYGEGTPFEKVALDDINLTIESGEIIGVIGHTGSGKSTLIQHFNGLLKPTSGKITIDGVDIRESKETLHRVRFDVGLVFQYPEYQLFEETVFKDIAFGPRNMGLSEEEITRRVLKAAEFVGIKQELLNKSPFELSGGQKRRVAIAGVIAMEPKVLILDEPAAGLDPKGRNKILNQIKAYHEATKSTVLLVSHSMEDVANYADRVLVMNDSRVFMYDETEKVFAKADELKKIRLSVPQVTNVFKKLSENGLHIADNVYTVNYAKEKILKALGTTASEKEGFDA